VRRLVTAMLAAVLLVSACGDDTSATNPGDAQLVSSLRTKIASSPQAQSDTFPITDQGAQCFAEGLVSELGADKVSAGIDLDFDAFMGSLSTSERRTVVDVMLGCIDVAGALTDQLVQGGTPISQDSARCIVDGMLASDDFRDAVGESFVSGDSSFQSDSLIASIMPVFLNCLTPEELANLGNS
jgi:hypothetical protein